MAMKYILFLAAASGFLPVLTLRYKAARARFKSLLTESPIIQEQIVNLHNKIRREVVPSASNMVKMSWGEEPAANARTVSKYCDTVESDVVDRRLAITIQQIEHHLLILKEKEDCRQDTFCGENIHLAPFPYSWSHVIEIWYNESKNFKYGEYISQDEVVTRHYTQLVWATSYLIGCGVAVCRQQRIYHYLYICHYCHEGNDPETIYLPYKEGPPCGDCPNHCDDKLCTNPCLFFDERTNCETQIKYLGCSHPSVQLFCKASCNCDTEIK